MLQSVSMKGTDVSIDFLFGVHVDKNGTRHTPWMEMADVCRAHYLSLQTAHLMIIMQCMIHTERFLLMYLLCLKAKRVLFPMSDRNRLSLLTLVEPCRGRDCKIMF